MSQGSSRASPERGVLVADGGARGRARLRRLDGPEVTFGRAPTCTHAFDEASLSRVHAKLVKEGGAYVIMDAGSSNGVFVNDVRVQRATLGDGDRVRLGSVIALRFQLVGAEEEKALQRVYESSVKDGLTGVWNRKYLDERLRGEIAYATRHRSPLAVVIADIDLFKKVNDTYGHLAGDEVLKVTAATMRSALRTEDILARYGGEEFVVVARGVDLKSAMQLAERLRDDHRAAPRRGRRADDRADDQRGGLDARVLRRGPERRAAPRDRRRAAVPREGVREKPRRRGRVTPDDSRSGAIALRAAVVAVRDVRDAAAVPGVRAAEGVVRADGGDARAPLVVERARRAERGRR